MSDKVQAAQDRHSEALAEFEQEQADAIARGYFPASYEKARKEAALSHRFLEARASAYRSALAVAAAPTLDLGNIGA